MQKFNVGDFVQLVGDKRKLVVAKSEPDDCLLCIWFTGDGFVQTYSFPEAFLEPWTPPSPGSPAAGGIRSGS